MMMKVTLTSLALLLCSVEGRLRGARKLQEDEEPKLQVVGNDGEFDVFPLGLCMGECDSDDDCEDGLYCFQRDPYESVPGCQDMGPGFDSRADYCVMKMDMPDMPMATVGPTSEETIVMTLGESVEMAPMMEEAVQAAEPEDGPMLPKPGDEDDMPAMDAGMDDDSPPAPEEIPAATVGPTTEAPMMDTPMMEDAPVGTVAPTEAETMDMTMGESVGIPVAASKDGHTAAEKTISPTVEESVMATIDGSGEEVPMLTEIMDMDEVGQLTAPGNNGRPREAFPLGKCQGDCDDDTECGEGLICWQRDFEEEVPGCVGNLASVTDYCVLAKYKPESEVEDVVEDILDTLEDVTEAPATDDMTVTDAGMDDDGVPAPQTATMAPQTATVAPTEEETIDVTLGESPEGDVTAVEKTFSS